MAHRHTHLAQPVDVPVMPNTMSSQPKLAMVHWHTRLAQRVNEPAMTKLGGL